MTAQLSDTARRRRAQSRPRTGVVVGIAVLALLAGACTSTGDDGGDGRLAGARAAAERAAEGLTTGTLAEVPLPDGADATAATAELEGIVEGLVDSGGGVEPTVELVEDSVDLAGDGARGQATVRWSWPLPSGTWEYDAPVRLAGSGDTWSVEWAPDLVEPTLQPGEVLETTTLEPARGDILGRRGTRLVTDRPVVRIGVDKTKVSARAAVRSAQAVAAAVDVDPAAYVDRVRAAGPEAFVEAIVLRQDDAAPALMSRLRATPGALALGTTMPLAPTRDFAAALLGRVGEATAEVVQESDGRVQPGDVVGLSGLAARYDEQLAGTRGVQVVAEGEDGQRRVLHEVAEVDGTPLRTTLDLALQTRAEQLLADVGPASALVALQPSTGSVLAAASGPGSDGYATANFGQYAPGSTFKVVTALALLRAGLTPQGTVDCAPEVSVDGKSFTNYDDYPTADLGRMSLRRAIASSCNTALIGERSRVDDGDLTRAAAALGLGVDHDLGFPAYFGQVPIPESATGAAASLIGQGRVLASPLAMATVIASVQAGRAVLPQLLPDHAVDQVPIEEPLTRAEAQALRSMLASVVTEGSGAALADVPGGPVIAKTGTAEYGEPDAAGELATHAWMVAAQGDLAVAAFVETGASGSRTAGPLLEELLRAG